MRYYKYDRDGYYAGFIVSNHKDEFYPRTTQVAPLPDKEGYRVRWNGSDWEYEEIPIPSEVEDEELPEVDPMEMEIDQLRGRRENECFRIIDRSPLWYETLTEAQLKEVREWYRAWLDVTRTMIVPDNPEWLK